MSKFNVENLTVEQIMEATAHAIQNGVLVVHCENCKKEINKPTEDWAFNRYSAFAPYYFLCADCVD